MNRRLLLPSLSLLCFICFGAADDSDSDIELGGKLTTFTNLQGHVYENVRLEHASLDGVIYSFTNTVGGGMAKYQDLSPDFLTSLNIPTNRIQIAEERAKLRAEQKARYDAEVRALALEQQRQSELAASNALALALANAKAHPAQTATNHPPAKIVRYHRK
jgi:hypothetical protein